MLSLQHSGFSGTIPTEIGQLSLLETLLLRGTTKVSATAPPSPPVTLSVTPPRS